MKRFLILSLLLGLCLSGAAQSKKAAYAYLDAGQMPDAVRFLPPPPSDTSTQFMYDITQHLWGKRQRTDSLRAAMAVRNATGNIDKMAAQFSEAFGTEISEEHTPAILQLLRRGVYTVRLAATHPKDHYRRVRPYVRFNEPTLVPGAEKESASTGSFPSGHTVRGLAMALLLIEINPDAQDELMRFAYEWGQSRVIAGYHWQSDVNASYLIAAAGCTRLHADPVFLADMAAAKAEFNRLSGE